MKQKTRGKSRGSSRSLVVVAYDISDDRRRAKVYDALLAFGVPVQYSVFECRLSREELRRLTALVRKLIFRKEDCVNLYHLCRTCQRRAESIGLEPPRPVHIAIL